MPSKTLMIRKPVYEALLKEKRTGESFSVLMERLLERRRGLASCFGLWNPSSRNVSRPPPPKAGGRRR